MSRMSITALLAAAIGAVALAGNAAAAPAFSPGETQCGTGAFLGVHSQNQVVGGVPSADADQNGDIVAAAVALYQWNGSGWQINNVVWMWSNSAPGVFFQDWRGFDGTDYGSAEGAGIVNGVVFSDLQPGYYYVRDWFYWYRTKQWQSAYFGRPSGSGASGSFYCTVQG
jgi:hypothetical protein